MNKPFKLKYKNSAFPFKSPLRQDDKNIKQQEVASNFLPRSFHSYGETKRTLRKIFETKQQIVARKLEHFKYLMKRKNKQYNKNKKPYAKAKTLINQNPTINPVGIAIKTAGPFVAAMLSSFKTGATTVIDPETGINKYTGEKEHTPF